MSCTPPALIFLPGWGLGRSPLEQMADATAGQILDLPGHGEIPDTANVELAVSTLAARLNSNTCLVGWSLGALLALAIAARVPEKVRKLVLVSGTASFIQRENWPHAVSSEILNGFHQGIASDLSVALPRFVAGFNRGDSRSKAVTLELMKGVDLSVLPSLPTLLTGLDWLRVVDLRAELPTIMTKTLLIHGDKDPLMPLAAAQALVEKMPNARLAIMEGCAHAPFTSQPEIFLNHLQSFIHG
jgi:pimeloyl-[acyl-carrier protein] methyl ester esterase